VIDLEPFLDRVFLVVIALRTSASPVTSSLLATLGGLFFTW